MPKLVDALQAGQKIMLDAGTFVVFNIVLAPPTKRGMYNAAHTSVTPVWYESLWHVIYAGEHVYYYQLMTITHICGACLCHGNVRRLGLCGGRP